MEVVQEVVVPVLLVVVVVEVVEVPGGGEGSWREANRDFIS